jgi:elongation factor 1-beta
MALRIFTGGKSSVLMDVKPWDDETDMKKLEEAVRSVQMEGLTWGACKSLSMLQIFLYLTI